MGDEQVLAERNFVEEVGIFFEQTGMPRMAGRILGWLLISDPPHQSPDELAASLMASKGSISTMTRLLIRIGLIERLSLPGVRHDYFRLRPGAWQHLIKESQEQIACVKRLAERGLDLLKGRDTMSRQWLEEMRDTYAFFDREFPALMARWEQEQARQRQALASE